MPGRPMGYVLLIHSIVKLSKAARVFSNKVVVAKLEPGDKVTILDVRGSWVGVKFFKDGKTQKGWVNKSIFD